MTRFQIVRLSLVRFATSFLVVLLVGVLNRIMIDELDIGRTVVGAILSLLHLATPLALYFGFLSDNSIVAGFRRTPFILLGMACCCLPMPFLPDLAHAISVSPDATLFILLMLALLLTIGFGIAVSTIALHALVVDRCPEKQRGEAMTLIWILTLGGFILAAPVFSLLIPSYDPGRLRLVFIVTAALTFICTLIGIWGQEKRNTFGNGKSKAYWPRGFRHVFRALNDNPDARLLFLFVALADFFFFSQEYVLEAFGADVYKLSIAQTTSFNLYMGVGILLGMISVHAIYNIVTGMKEKAVIGVGCVVSGLSFSLLAWSSLSAMSAVLFIAVFTLGIGKGIFNVGMARLMVRITREDISGVIMGLWAVIGGLSIGIGEAGGAALVDIAANITGSVPLGYGILFVVESAGLMLCLLLIARFRFVRYREHLDGRLPAAMSPEWT